MLIWKEGKWQITDGDSQNYPLAYIKFISSNAIEVEAWDKGERKKYKFAILMQSSLPVSGKAMELISNIRLRTQKQISCLIGGQRMVLREWDWVIKKEGRWKIVKSIEDLDNLQNNPQIEEFFYFKKVVKKNGSKNLLGYRFNQMGTHMVGVNVPIRVHKRENKKGK